MVFYLFSFLVSDHFANLKSPRLIGNNSSLDIFFYKIQSPFILDFLFKNLLSFSLIEFNVAGVDRRSLNNLWNFFFRLLQKVRIDGKICLVFRMQTYVNKVYILRSYQKTFWSVKFRVIRINAWFFVSLAYEYLHFFCWVGVVECEETPLVETTEFIILLLILRERNQCWLRWEHFNCWVNRVHAGNFVF